MLELVVCSSLKRGGNNLLVSPSEWLWRPTAYASFKESPAFSLQATRTPPKYTYPSLFKVSLEVQLFTKIYLIKKKNFHEVNIHLLSVAQVLTVNAVIFSSFGKQVRQNHSQKATSLGKHVQADVMQNSIEGMNGSDFKQHTVKSSLFSSSKRHAFNLLEGNLLLFSLLLAI